MSDFNVHGLSGDPLSEEETEKIRNIIKGVVEKKTVDLERKTANAHDEFIDAAKVYGFTRDQARFLWLLRVSPPLKLGG